jgi:hemoglobin
VLLSRKSAGTIVLVEEYEVYSVIGEEGFARLIAAFYRRVPQDDILGPMYPREDLAGAEERLRDFLIFRFGGPQRYIDLRGHPRLRMRHARFAVGNAARDRWMELMNQALEEANLPAEAVEVLRPFLEGTATFLINQHEA